MGNCRLLLVSGPKVLDGDCSDCKIPPGGKVGRSSVADGSLGDSSGCWDARHLLNRTGDVLEERKKNTQECVIIQEQYRNMKLDLIMLVFKR